MILFDLLVFDVSVHDAHAHSKNRTWVDTIILTDKTIKLNYSLM